VLLLEVRWCVECEGETALERPGGPGTAEGACVDCGAAVFLWAELLELDALDHPAAISVTPTSAVATPAA